jgi:ankyrin repeat protein
MKTSIKTHPHVKNALSASGWPLLVIAAHYGHAIIVQYLLRRGVTVDARTTVEHRSALQVACINVFPEIVEILVTAGADATRVDTANRSAMWYALHSNHGGIVATLLNDAENREGVDDDWLHDRLYDACYLGHANTAAVILDIGDSDGNIELPNVGRRGTTTALAAPIQTGDRLQTASPCTWHLPAGASKQSARCSIRERNCPRST